MKVASIINALLLCQSAAAAAAGSSGSRIAAPAATTATAFTPGAPPLFAGETVQLTDNVLRNLTASLQHENVSSLFAFGDKHPPPQSPRQCKAMPGDAAWPSPSTWELFAQLLGGSLLRPAPLAAPCYADWPEYDNATCYKLSMNWFNSSMHINHPTSVMNPLYTGRSCMAFGFNYTSTCTEGGYATYVVNASSVAQIQLAVNFARNANLRLVVKNTGHDFSGKSAGKGALSVWTHALNDRAFYPSFAADGGYVGPAIKLGAGVQAFVAYEFAKQNNVTVVGGEGVTVGLAGGYTLGGGHSPLSGLYGMAADQVLALQVVLADGRFITATATQHPDFYWMLCGGGGSTIGVVTSITVKAYPRLPTTTVTFNFTVASAPGPAAFWAGVEAYIDNIERLVDAGTYAYYDLGASSLQRGTNYPGDTDYYLRIQSLLAPNMTIPETQRLLQPWFDTLDRLHIAYTPVYHHADNFHDAWKPAFPQEYMGGANTKIASRLLPRQAYHDAGLRRRNFLAHKDAVAQQKGYSIAGFHLTGKGKAAPQPPRNAVLPAWRDTLTHAIVVAQWNSSASWAVVKERSLGLTRWMQALRDLGDSGVYMSEADLLEPALQEAFYGANYPRLYALKQRYDPWGVFFALTAVGAEDWVVRVEDPLPLSWNNNGRLCPRG
ncbi:FAD binding domain protein [Aspergillus homomorphus CBS 101889]|uniref:FAD binding domain protein n=1 Tax=Aspergillus homomorphus (strain CBS 101889) TaxID=1450537 RepID=A0A395HPD8_ASPHC|nr:FAD binding domain protein [Aspergillus homomorphus CBS 101889]RAL09349.1 FAD binding domain protein [Aspergillus homomorphus CBS 101889]